MWAKTLALVTVLLPFPASGLTLGQPGQDGHMEEGAELLERPKALRMGPTPRPSTQASRGGLRQAHPPWASASTDQVSSAHISGLPGNWLCFLTALTAGGIPGPEHFCY